MTDNEIIKDLEELRKEQENGYVTALEFGGKRDFGHEEFLDLLSATIDLINRLGKQNLSVIEHLKKARKQLKNAKAEAIKEFVYRLEDVSYSYPAKFVFFKDINLVYKEVTTIATRRKEEGK